MIISTCYQMVLSNSRTRNIRCAIHCSSGNIIYLSIVIGIDDICVQLIRSTHTHTNLIHAHATHAKYKVYKVYKALPIFITLAMWHFYYIQIVHLHSVTLLPADCHCHSLHRSCALQIVIVCCGTIDEYQPAHPGSSAILQSDSIHGTQPTK